MIFLFEMTAFMDDDVLDVFGWEVNEIEVQRDFLVIGTGSSFGFRFSETEFFVCYPYLFTVFLY